MPGVASVLSASDMGENFPRALPRQRQSGHSSHCTRFDADIKLQNGIETEAKMDSPERARTPTPSPLDAERARLRKEGFEDLRSADGAPLWWVHPQHGNEVDVVALPIKPHTDAEMYPINGMPSAPLIAAVGTDIFVLGYPFGIGPAAFQYGSAGASLPNQIFSTINYTSSCTASHPGMSGAPVIRRSWGSHSYENGSVVSNTLGAATKFVGVYSGRWASSDPFDAQLGLAWPAALVTEIVSGRRSTLSDFMHLGHFFALFLSPSASDFGLGGNALVFQGLRRGQPVAA
jgi:Trypsin-like peptidase domain